MIGQVLGLDLASVLASLSILGAVFCAGGLCGLHLAWTQETKMRRWADSYARLYERNQ